MGLAAIARHLMHDPITGYPQTTLANTDSTAAWSIRLFHFITYLWLDQFFDWPEIWADIVKRPFITFGMLAVIGLLPLAITSNRFSQRKLGGKWRKLHQLIYPISILAVLHFFWLVKADMLRPTILSLCLGLLLLYRLIKRQQRRRNG